MSKRIIIPKVIFLLSIFSLLLYSLVLHNTTPSVYLSVILFSIIMLSLSNSDLEYNKFFLFLGKISFSFYLIHYGVIKLFEEYNSFGLNNYIALFFIFVITLTLSIISYKYVESVFIHLGKNTIKVLYEK